MNKQTRLSKLETQAATLPPDGAYLGSVYERLAESERGAWWDARTDAEIEAIAQTDPKCAGLNFDRLTENELQFIADTDDSAKFDEWIAQLRITKPDCFSEAKR